jgi:hypothetical protein
VFMVPCPIPCLCLFEPFRPAQAARLLTQTNFQKL